MADGAFSDRVRAGVHARDADRCVGCRRTSPLTLQHRRARGRGGVHGAAAERSGSAANALLLHGSGTTGCHGWCESHPDEAERLGWRIGAFDPREARQVPVFGWWMGQLLWRYLDPSDECMWRFATTAEHEALPPVEVARLWLPVR